ncbi:hypothetical protein NEF87_004359 [Candidatus Lokiarchaeum ossiferum]|uniref:Uncharacterized protein n=1 Tax=Candidatus Lokiarchaeum ossiferum TaxID=2951803 RepID=A0ABY6I041_9ARCH|nr:hypothetical protein NEF87_004359 [Candidatus Lokiarchaeum sp. B-35]
MDKEPPKKRTLEKFGDDFKNSLVKFQKDFNTLFKLPIKEKDTRENRSSEELLELNEQTQVTGEKSAEFQTDIQKKWETFISKSNLDFKALEESWIQSMDQMKAKNEERRNLRKNRREAWKKRQKEEREKIRAFFQAQNQQIESTFQNMEKNIQDRKIQNRDKMYQNLDNMQKRWDKVMDKQQKFIENSFSSVNSFGWKQSMKILLIVVPILVILIIIFSLMKPFLPI